MNSNTSDLIEDLYNTCGNQAEIAKKFWLFSIGKGWLHLTDEGDYWFVLYTSDKDTHHILNGPALGADFEKTTGERKIRCSGLTGAWESAINMWPVKDEEKAEQIFNIVRRYVHQAHQYNCK